MGKLNDIEKTYIHDVKVLFETETGRRVLEYWVKGYVLATSGAGDGERVMAYQSGRRDFILNLMDEVTLAPGILKAILAEQPEEDYDDE